MLCMHKRIVTICPLSMIESARMHIRAADKALASGNATGALDQVNFAQMQLSMMGMKNIGM